MEGLTMDGMAFSLYNGSATWDRAGVRSSSINMATKYYFFGGQRVAMRNKTGLTFMHGDMLGSASLATSLTGGKISELRYKPFGEVRLLSNQTATDRTFTGQRVERGIGNINNTLMVHILDDAVQHLPEATSPRSYFPKPQLGCTIAGMSRTQTDPSVLHYNSIASQYDQMLTSIPGDRWVRQAFQSFVTQHVPPGKLLLDFGCGTGTDALSYIGQGYRVIGYDNSPGMLGELRHKCAAEIARGQIMCYGTPYRKFLSSGKDTGDPAPDAVTANFAVLNLIDELAPLFDAFAKMLVPHGQVIVSVLNPFFWKEMIHPAWWKANRIDLASQTVCTNATSSTAIRHFVSRIDRAASSHFARIDQASVGALVRYSKVADQWEQPASLAARIESRLWRAPPLNRSGKFLFLAYQWRS